MKPKTTRKFFVEWKGRYGWCRSFSYAETLAKAKKIGKRIGGIGCKDPMPMRIVEAVTAETIHKV